MSIRELSVHAAHSDAVWGVSWSGASQIATGGVDEQLKVWTVQSGEASGTGSARVDPKAKLVASAQTVLNAAQQAEGQVLPLSASLALLSVVAVPHSSLLVTSSMDGLIRVYDTELGEHVRRIEAGALECWTVCVDPTGQFVAAGSQRGSVHVFSVASGERLSTLVAEKAKEGETASAWVMSVAWSRDGRHLAAGHYDGRVSLWAMQGAAALAPARPLTPHAKAVRALQFAADSSLLFTGSDDMHVHWYDVGANGAGMLVHDLYAHSSWVTAIDLPFASTGVVGADSPAAAGGASASAHSPLSPTTFTTTSTDKRVKVWSVATRECLATLELDSAVWSVAYDPASGDKIAVGTEQGSLAIFQVPTQ